MKILHTLNLISFILTLGLYITLIGGLIAQFFLGIIQLLIAALLLFKYPKHQLPLKKHLLIYWGLSLVYLTSLFFIKNANFSHTALWILYIAVLPMAIAAYFVGITNCLKK